MDRYGSGRGVKINTKKVRGNSQTEKRAIKETKSPLSCLSGTFFHLFTKELLAFNFPHLSLKYCSQKGTPAMGRLLWSKRQM